MPFRSFRTAVFCSLPDVRLYHNRYLAAFWLETRRQRPYYVETVLENEKENK